MSTHFCTVPSEARWSIRSGLNVMPLIVNWPKASSKSRCTVLATGRSRRSSFCTSPTGMAFGVWAAPPAWIAASGTALVWFIWPWRYGKAFSW